MSAPLCSQKAPPRSGLLGDMEKAQAVFGQVNADRLGEHKDSSHSPLPEDWYLQLGLVPSLGGVAGWRLPGRAPRCTDWYPKSSPGGCEFQNGGCSVVLFGDCFYLSR